VPREDARPPEEVFDAVPVAGERLGPVTAVHRAGQLLMRLEQRRGHRRRIDEEAGGEFEHLTAGTWNNGLSIPAGTSGSLPYDPEVPAPRFKLTGPSSPEGTRGESFA
jgi:hypothetical protein